MGGGRDTLLFDLDGTLVDSAPAIAQALSIQRGKRGLPAITVETVRPWISLGADVLVRRALAGGARGGSADLAEFRVLLGSLPAEADCLYPNVVSSLRGLAAAGWKMAVVTNKPEGLSRQLLGALGLDARFPVVIGGDSTAHAKPHSAPLLRALDLLGSSAGQSLFIGDSDVDREAARGLDIPFLLFSGGYGATPGGDAMFDDYATLADLIESVAGA